MATPQRTGERYWIIALGVCLLVLLPRSCASTPSITKSAS